MTELLNYADNWIGLRRVEFMAFSTNTSAIALYEKLGFEREGLLRDYAFRNGGYVDAIWMARLRR